MERPTVHTVHLHAFWDSPGNDFCRFTCPACGNHLMAQRPPATPAAFCTHFFQPCHYCGVPTSLTVQGYFPNPTGEAPAPSVPDQLQRAAAAPPATRPESPEQHHQAAPRRRTIKQWRKRGDLDGTYIGGLKEDAITSLYCRFDSHEARHLNEAGKDLYTLDELEEMEAWLKTKLDH